MFTLNMKVLRWNKTFLMKLAAIVLLIPFSMYIVSIHYHAQNHKFKSESSINLNEVQIAIVICGKSLSDSLLAIKSVIRVTPPPIHFHLIVDEQSRRVLEKKLSVDYIKEVTFTFYSTKEIPEEDEIADKPCVWSHISIHRFITSTEWIILLDTKSVALSSIRELWDYRKTLSSRQFIAAPYLPILPDENQLLQDTHYPVPYVPPMPVDSSPLLMNIWALNTKFEWDQKLSEYFKQYEESMYGSNVLENILNVLLYHNEHIFAPLPPYWDFYEHYCSVCTSNKGCNQEYLESDNLARNLSSTPVVNSFLCDRCEALKSTGVKLLRYDNKKSPAIMVSMFKQAFSESTQATLREMLVEFSKERCLDLVNVTAFFNPITSID